MSGRCKECNRAMTANEVIWYPEEKRHEEFCTTCRYRHLEMLDECALEADLGDVFDGLDIEISKDLE